MSRLNLPGIADADAAGVDADVGAGAVFVHAVRVMEQAVPAVVPAGRTHCCSDQLI